MAALPPLQQFRNRLTVPPRPPKQTRTTSRRPSSRATPSAARASCRISLSSTAAPGRSPSSPSSSSSRSPPSPAAARPSSSPAPAGRRARCSPGPSPRISTPISPSSKRRRAPWEVKPAGGFVPRARPAFPLTRPPAPRTAAEQPDGRGRARRRHQGHPVPHQVGGPLGSGAARRPDPPG